MRAFRRIIDWEVALLGRLGRYALPAGLTMQGVALAVHPAGFLGWYLSLGGCALVLGWALDQRHA